MNNDILYLVITTWKVIKINIEVAPLYIRIYELILKDIQNGLYQVNDKLPSERKLCEIYSVSRITIREALNHLEKEQYIKRIHGKGSFVLGSQYMQFLDNLYNFKDEIEKSGDKASTQMIGIELKKSTPYIQEKMNLKSFQYVYELKRLRLANGIPLIYEVSYLPLKYCEGIDKFDFNYVSLYETLDKYYNIQITDAYETLTASKLSQDCAQLLNNKVDESCMYIERFSYYGDEVIEYKQSVVSGYKYKYTAKLM